MTIVSQNGRKIESLRVVAERIPAELKARAQWVGWRWERRGEKWTKPPIDVKTGRFAKPNDPTTWASFDEAWAAYEAGRFDLDGVGYVFTEDDPFAGVDLDNCADAWQLEPWAKAIVKALGSYAEYSPSGAGVKIFCRASIARGVNKANGWPVEMYDRGRYFTLTGEHVSWTPDDIQPAQDAVDALFRMVTIHQADEETRDAVGELLRGFMQEAERERAPLHPVSFEAASAELTPDEMPAPHIDGSSQERETPARIETRPAPARGLTDSEIIGMALAAKNGETFRRLWEGDASGYPSASHADLALMNILAFWTGGDPDQMERIARRSGLYRPKWDGKHSADGRTYLEMTIDKALKRVTERYDPGYRSNGRGPRSDRGQATPASTGGKKLAFRETDFPLDDYGNAELVMRLHPNRFAHTTTHGWLSYVPELGYWTTEFDDAAAKKVISEVLRQRIAQAWESATDDEGIKRAQAVTTACKPNAHRVRAVLEALRTLAFTTIDKLAKPAPHLLNVENGVVNLRTGELLPHSPDYGFLYVAPVEYAPNADAALWVEFLRSAVGDDMADWLQVAVGYSISGDTREEVLFYLIGPKRAGKGTFTETLNAMLGPALAKEVGFSIFTVNQRPDDQNFALAPLHQARIVFASESNRYERFNEAKIKRLTGGNDIYCAFKRRDFFSYRPVFKIWLSSNHPVNADPDDDAVWSRIQVIPFPNSFAGREDRTLKARLKTPEALRGVLAWAVAGAVRWYKAGRLPENVIIKSATKTQRDQLDNVQAWLDERTDQADSCRERFSRVWADYRDWCELNGVRPKHKQGLSEALRKKGFVVKRARVAPGSDRKVTFVFGICLED